MKDYDIRSAFEEMELELIRSMKRNLSRHQKWEEKEGINWTMWQAEQLKTLEQFKRENKKKFTKKFSLINDEIKEFLKDTYEMSGLDQEKEILEAITKGKSFNSKVKKGLEGSFFILNEDKMNALIKATTKDMSKAEHAMLRMANDQYRKTIFKAQVMANSGAFTLQQSIDAATKDFLKAGINCIQYKDGRRVNIASYAEMCIRTANKRAMLVSEGDVRNEYGVHTVRISKYGGCSETCLPWQGKVYVDDVFSGGTKEEAKEKNLKLLSEAIEGGLFHPNCKHRSTTYFYDLKKEQGKLKDDGIENPPEEQEHRRNQLHIQQQKRLEEGSLDPQNIKEAKARKEQWIKKDKVLEYEQIQKISFVNEKFSDVTDEYLNQYLLNDGKIVFDDNYKNKSHKSEIENANWIIKLFGGEVKLKNEINQPKLKNADYEWNNKLWDLKDISTSKAADKALRKGLKQIASNPGGIILNLINDDIIESDVCKIIEYRINRSSKFDVDILIKRKNKLLRVIRYKK